MKKTHIFKSFLKLTLFAILFAGCSNDETLAPLGSPGSNSSETNLKSSGKTIKPPLGLVGWWPGDGFTYDIVNGNNGALINSATYNSGMVDQSFSFDGIDDYVSIPDNPLWTLGDEDFTIDLWAYFNSIPFRAPLVDHNEGGGETNKWVFWYDEMGHREPYGPALRFHINSPSMGPLDPVTFPWLPNIGEWYHLGITRDGDDYTLFINGQAVITETDNHTIPDAVVNLSFGQSEWSYFFDGMIDEIELFNRALTSSEMKSIFEAGSKGKFKTVSICHKPCTPAQKQLVVPIQALEAHLQHGDFVGPCSKSCCPSIAAEFVLSGGTNPEKGIYVDDYLRVYINSELIAEITQGGHSSPPAEPIHFIANSGDVLRIIAQDANECYSLDALWFQKINGSCLTLITEDVYGPNCGSEPFGQIFFDQTFILP